MNEELKQNIKSLAERFNVLDNTIAEHLEPLKKLRDELEDVNSDFTFTGKLADELDDMLSGLDSLIQSIENMPATIISSFV